MSKMLKLTTAESSYEIQEVLAFSGLVYNFRNLLLFIMYFFICKDTTLFV